MQCIAFTQRGTQCNHRGYVVGRCNMHDHKRAVNGPNWTDRMELIWVHTRIRRAFAGDHLAYGRIVRLQRIQMAGLLDDQERRFIETGIDPDAHTIHRRVEIVRHRPPPPPRPERQLLAFATDPQNVHTTIAVTETKKIVDILLTIPVPSSFKWNMRRVSKTPGCIIMNCRLSPKAAHQMMTKYCSDESIYELGIGIYGRILDAVWQFIKSSPEREDLTKIIASELTDNIGMCAQGNLSRLCNVLAGYMEGIGSQESVAEILGREFPKLMEIESSEERMDRAINILKTNKVPEDQWSAWTDALA